MQEGSENGVEEGDDVEEEDGDEEDITMPSSSTDQRALESPQLKLPFVAA